MDTWASYSRHKQFLWQPLSTKGARALTIRIGVPTIDGARPIVANLEKFVHSWQPCRGFSKRSSTSWPSQGQQAEVPSVQVGARQRAHGEPARKGQQPSGYSPSSAMADKLVFSKLKAKFSGRLRFFIQLQPLSREIAEC